MLQWSREELADRAKVSARTITDFEIGKRQPINSTLQAIQSALEQGGIRITEDGGVIPPQQTAEN